MAELVASDIQMPGPDVVLKGYLVYPKGAKGSPGVLVHPEAGGLTDQTRGVARRLAAEGYAVLAYDLYSRQPEAPIGAPFPDIVKYYERITDEQALLDLDATLVFFRALSIVDPDRIGVLGFCSAYPILLACHDLRLAACVSFYNQIRYMLGINADLTVNPLDRIPSLWCPLLGHYGDQDGACPMSDIQALEGRLKEFRKTYELYIYPGAQHGFFNETGPAYDKGASEEAWPRVLSFLRAHLGA